MALPLPVSVQIPEGKSLGYRGTSTCGLEDDAQVTGASLPRRPPAARSPAPRPPPFRLGSVCFGMALTRSGPVRGRKASQNSILT